jgi:hypothetical protein
VSSKRKLLYVLGTTRSGSTIVERILGQLHGFAAAGEVHWLWRALAQDIPCGCGKLIDACPVWSEVLARATVDDPPAADPQVVIRWQIAEARIAHTLRIFRLSRWPQTGRPVLDRYVRLLGRVHRALRESTDAAVVVDSSKTPAVAEILRHESAIDLYVLHLVRDPRAFAYSWRRGAPNPEGGRSYKPGAFRCAGRWIATNVLGDAVRRRVPSNRTMILRYEDFVADPRSTTGSILRWLGEDDSELPFVNEHIARLEAVTHTASGNRSRFSTGDVEVRLDDEWKTPRRDLRRGVVTLLTMPWLRRYGYRRSFRD